MTNSVVYAYSDFRHPSCVLDTDELLERLKGVRNVDIAKALGLPDSRIPEIRRKERALKLDEAVKLVRAFRLEQAPQAPAIPPSVLRLAIRHVANRLQADPDEDQIAELEEDLKAFSEYVSRRSSQGLLVAAEGFLDGLLTHRPAHGAEARLQNGHGSD